MSLERKPLVRNTQVRDFIVGIDGEIYPRTSFKPKNPSIHSIQLLNDSDFVVPVGLHGVHDVTNQRELGRIYANFLVAQARELNLLGHLTTIQMGILSGRERMSLSKLAALRGVTKQDISMIAHSALDKLQKMIGRRDLFDRARALGLSLTPEQGIVVRMMYYQGLPACETAEFFGKDASDVYKLEFKARKKAERLLSQR